MSKSGASNQFSRSPNRSKANQNALHKDTDFGPWTTNDQMECQYQNNFQYSISNGSQVYGTIPQLLPQQCTEKSSKSEKLRNYMCELDLVPNAIATSAETPALEQQAHTPGLEHRAFRLAPNTSQGSQSKSRRLRPIPMIQQPRQRSRQMLPVRIVGQMQSEAHIYGQHPTLTDKQADDFFSAKRGSCQPQRQWHQQQQAQHQQSQHQQQHQESLQQEPPADLQPSSAQGVQAQPPRQQAGGGELKFFSNTESIAQSGRAGRRREDSSSQSHCRNINAQIYFKLNEKSFSPQCKELPYQ